MEQPNPKGLDVDLSALEVLAGAGEVDVSPGRLGRAGGHVLVRVCAAVLAAPAHKGLGFTILECKATGGGSRRRSLRRTCVKGPASRRR